MRVSSKLRSTTLLRIGPATIVAVLVGCVGLALSARGIRAKGEIPAVTSGTSKAIPAATGPSQRRRFEAETVTISASGFQPLEITRGEGKFFLVVDDVSGLPELNLRLDREQGERVHAVRLRREDRNSSQQLDLRPGRYLLTEANHADWLCRITITR